MINNKMCSRVFVVAVLCFACCYGQEVNTTDITNLTRVRNGLEEKIGNFSIELLFHTAKLQPATANLIMSPITMWSALAVISQGASGQTRLQINHALRITSKHYDEISNNFVDIAKWLRVKTTTVELAKFNGIFVDKESLLLPDFKEDSKKNFEAETLTLNFTDSVNSANILNKVISNVTHGRIPKLVDPSYFENSKMVLTSALYFKGQWTMPFNASSTMKQPFFDSNGTKIGEVNMMYNRATYPFSNIKALKARVIELPYGKENRLSMIIMLPNYGVSIEEMFYNFRNVHLDSFFEELRLSKEEFADDEVDCFIPRFKIESNLDMTDVLRDRMGIKDLFDQSMARLPNIARTPLYVSKIVHKAEIEVTEEGTTASAVTTAEFSNRIGTVRFEASRPFTYLIVEKVTNSIVFGGFYKEPSLY